MISRLMDASIIKSARIDKGAKGLMVPKVTMVRWFKYQLREGVLKNLSQNEIDS